MKPLENVEVVTSALFHCHAKEDLLHVTRADAHDDAYFCPVPVVTAGKSVLCVVVVVVDVDVDSSLNPTPDAT